MKQTAHANKVELLGFYGGDEAHALSAWTSTARELTDDKKDRMQKMLSTLAEAGHHTPFEKSYLHFLLTVETATHIQLLKHRVGVSVNAESARYKELKDDKYYVPYDWSDNLKTDVKNTINTCYVNYHRYIEQLIEQGVSRKRAKESARFILPYANQLILDISFNFRSFMHFQGLRNKENAQDEIRLLAQQMLELVKNTGKFSMSLRAFGYVK